MKKERRRGRGRPRCPRRLEKEPASYYYKPRGIPAKQLEEIEVSPEEIEAIRLVDIKELNQKKAAEKMNISRKTFWTDLKKARKKITEALVTGKAIKIKEGDYELEKE